MKNSATQQANLFPSSTSQVPANRSVGTLAEPKKGDICLVRIEHGRSSGALHGYLELYAAEVTHVTPKYFQALTIHKVGSGNNRDKLWTLPPGIRKEKYQVVTRDLAIEMGFVNIPL